MRLSNVLLVSSLLALSAGLPAQAHAQRTYAIGIMGGASIPTGKFSDAYSNGIGATGFVALGAAELPIGMRLDGVYSNFSGRNVSPPGGGAEVITPDLRLWGIVGNLIITTSGTTAKPYVVLGAGFYNTKVDLPDEKSRNDLGFSIGLGSTFNFGPLTTAVETRFHSISREPENGGSIHFIPVTIGIVF